MPELIAQGSEPQLRWRRRVPSEGSFVIGRASGDWSVAWDNHVSRSHISAQWANNRLRIQKLPLAKNPVFYQGSPSDSFELPIGHHFVIGATLFTLVDEAVPEPEDSSAPMSEQTYSSAFLRKLQYRDSAQRVSVLSRLPEVIARASDDEQLFQQIVDVLLSGVPEAEKIAVVDMAADSNDMEVRVMHWDGRSQKSTSFTPSRRLVRRAVESDESVLHVWDLDLSQPAGAFTMVEDTLWSFATPIRGVAPQGRRWCIYVAGKTGIPSLNSSQTDKKQLQEDMKFAELTASTIANLIRLRRLERSQTSLRQFFSPVVMQTLADASADPEEVLRPRATDVSVLFCDLQGFTRINEQFAHDLMGLLDRVSRVLGLTTHEIFEHGGVVGDFHGDAVMGFWGWPIAGSDYVTRACLAALAIRTAVNSLRDDVVLSDFKQGLGMATGTAVAGKIGTEDQVKVTVFGPVANLASRLETLTRRIRANVLIDNVTAEHVRNNVDAGIARVRRVARIIPYGMDNDVWVHELLPPFGIDCPNRPEELMLYEKALDEFQGRNWEVAFKLLNQLPAHDEVKDFLLSYIGRFECQAPPSWDGIIRMESK